MYTTKFGEKEYTFSPWSQGIMEAFSAWLYERVLNERLHLAEAFRKKARKRYKEGARMRDFGIDNTDNLNAEQRVKMQDDYEDVVGEAQSLEYEARIGPNDVADNRATGAYHFFGALARQARDQFDGRVRIAYLSLLPKHPAITVAEVEQLARKNWRGLDMAMAEAQNESKKDERPGDSTPTNPPTTSETPSTSASVAA